MDMSHSFISREETLLHNVSITFDKFHVIKTLNRALYDVPRSKQKHNPLLKNSRCA
ncbi:MAG: transposase [Christensenellaceae bacterium]|nr:transposase [Christensenellaceae bacterium]